MKGSSQPHLSDFAPICVLSISGITQTDAAVRWGAHPLFN